MLPPMKRAHYYWLLQVLGWSAIALFTALFINQFSPLSTIYFPLAAWCGATGLLLSEAWHRLCRRRQARGQALAWPAALVATVVLGTVQAASNLAMDQLISGGGWNSAPPGWIMMLLLFWSGIMLAWNVAYMAALSLRRNQRLEAEALLLEAETLRLEVLAKDAELRALQSQVNPHFFFNSLNSVRALMYEDRDNAANMIDQLATLMRYTLMSTFTDCVPLAQELGAVRAYLAIEQIRFEERLRARFEIEAGMEGVTIPPMSLQTLVENAVKYGVEPRSAGSEIRIIARQDGAGAVIEVANQGVLRANPGATRVGLSNARKRLELAKGGQASLDLSEHEGWVRATLRFPLAA
ncbi:sensor histidine kinase [Pseudoduganella sp. DS3]|uniref:Sensor histidine kinase n=2 Tax=Pseudoduganella guangdongensis TaxID=2692179 RepID=A0A6N9HQR3_9BURK|nr:sensor histidine kinase [Pseudoduganella guangdongensis]